MIGPITTAAATGGAGAAAATAYSSDPVSGVLMAIIVQYNDAPPASTDVGVKTKGASGVLPSIALLTLSNANTNGYFFVRTATYKTDGTADGGYGAFVVNDIIQIDIAQANDGDSVSVWLEIVS